MIFLFTSFRFEEIFCDRETVRGVQKQLEVVIEEGVEKLGVLLSQKMDDKHSKVKKMTKIQKSKIKRKWGVALIVQTEEEINRKWMNDVQCSWEELCYYAGAAQQACELYKHMCGECGRDWEWHQLKKKWLEIGMSIFALNL